MPVRLPDVPVTGPVGTALDRAARALTIANELIGDPDTVLHTYGNIRPGSTATLSLCWVAPADQLDGAFMELRWDDGGLFIPFSLEPAPEASPEASPVASPMSH